MIATRNQQLNLASEAQAGGICALTLLVNAEEVLGFATADMVREAIFRQMTRSATTPHVAVAKECGDRARGDSDRLLKDDEERP